MLVDAAVTPAKRGRLTGHALADLLRSAARLDRTQSDPVVAARNAIGVGLPLAVAVIVTGGAGAGLPSAIGALQTAFADRPGPYRLRMLRMSVTALAATVTSTLAVLCSGSDVASALLLLVIGVVAGLLLATGPSGTQVGVAGTAAALILGHQAESPSVALHVGLLVLAGGAVQVLLAVAAWPLGRHAPERRVLAGLYRSLAGLARAPLGTRVGPPLGDQLTSVRQTLYGLGHDHGPSVEAYRVLLDEAERIRRELLVLGGYVDRLTREGATPAAQALRSVLDGCADALDAVAGSLAEARPVDLRALEVTRQRVRAAVDLLGSSDTAGGERTRLAALVRVRALVGQLRAAIETARTGASEGSRGEEPDLRRAGRTPVVSRLRDPLAIVRANVTLDSAVLRHALRLGVLVSVSDFVVRSAGVDRGYWVPLTVLVVLRPDFASTFQRSSMRALGTIVGLLLASVLVHFVPGGDWYSIVLIVLFFFGMRLAGPGNIGLSAVCLSALVVILLGLAGFPPGASVERRGLDTLIGAALALLATLLWPVWERQVVRGRLATLLRAYRDYTLDVADLTFDLPRLQRARAASRLARTNAQASVDRARAEPVSADGQVELGEAVLVHSHRYVHAVLTLDALRPPLREAGGVPELGALEQLAAEALERCAVAVLDGVAPRERTGLRDAHDALMAALADPSRLGGPDVAAAVLDATDRVVNSVDTLVTELRRQFGPATSPGLLRRG